jgi:hypothetical protein
MFRSDGFISFVTRGLDPRVHPFSPEDGLPGQAPATTPNWIDLTEIGASAEALMQT